MGQRTKLRLRKLAHPGSLKSAVEGFCSGWPDLGKFALACLQIMRPVRMMQPFAIEYDRPGQEKGGCGPFYFPKAFCVPEEICARDKLKRVLKNEVMAAESGVPLNPYGVLDAAVWHSRSGRDAWYRMLKPDRCYANLQTLAFHAPGAIELAKICADLGFAGQKWRVIGAEIADKRARERVAERLHEIKAVVGSYHALSIDTQGTWHKAAALEFLRSIDSGLLDWIEDLNVEIVSAVPTSERRVRFSTGEKWSTYTAAEAQLSTGHYSIAHPDAFVCGGVSELTRIAELAQDLSIEMKPHGRTLIESIIASREVTPEVPMVFEFNPVLEPLRQLPFGRKCVDLFSFL